MVQPSVFSFSLFLLFLHFTQTLAQSPLTATPPAQPPPVTVVQPPPAAAATSPGSAQVPPTTSGTPEIDKILTKASHFGIFLRLLKATQEDNELFTVLNTTTNGVTIFAPTDSAFSLLKVGTLNSMSDKEKTELVKFHIIPKFISSSQFQTESNPVKTQAGTGDRVSLNVTMTGTSVNITTGLTNTSISGTVYADGQLAIYQVDNVLLPLDIFSPKPPAPAPGPGLTKGKPNKQAASATADAPSVAKDNSGSVSLVLQKSSMVFSVVLGIVAAISLLVVM